MKTIIYGRYPETSIYFNLHREPLGEVIIYKIYKHKKNGKNSHKWQN